MFHVLLFLAVVLDNIAIIQSVYLINQFFLNPRKTANLLDSFNIYFSNHIGPMGEARKRIYMGILGGRYVSGYYSRGEKPTSMNS